MMLFIIQLLAERYAQHLSRQNDEDAVAFYIATGAIHKVSF